MVYVSIFASCWARQSGPLHTLHTHNVRLEIVCDQHHLLPWWLIDVRMLARIRADLKRRDGASPLLLVVRSAIGSEMGAGVSATRFHCLGHDRVYYGGIGSCRSNRSAETISSEGVCDDASESRGCLALADNPEGSLVQITEIHNFCRGQRDEVIYDGQATAFCSVMMAK